MTPVSLDELRDFLQHHPNTTWSGMELTGYGSWRGTYSEPCLYCQPHGQVSSDQLLEAVNNLLENTFVGYKGGEYTYHSGQTVHFENYDHSCSDGEFQSELEEGCTLFQEMADFFGYVLNP